MKYLYYQSARRQGKIIMQEYWINVYENGMGCKWEREIISVLVPYVKPIYRLHVKVKVRNADLWVKEYFKDFRLWD